VGRGAELPESGKMQVGRMASSAICNEERALWRIFDDRDSETFPTMLLRSPARTGYKENYERIFIPAVLDA